MSKGKEPAYPSNDKTGMGYTINHGGLTKRELFAAMAMQGLCANLGGRVSSHAIAEQAWKTADALLAELERTA